MGLRMPAFGGIQEGDRRDSNPGPPEPQSDDIGFWALPGVAIFACLSLFSCSRSPDVSACCVPGGVRRRWITRRRYPFKQNYTYPPINVCAAGSRKKSSHKAEKLLTLFS
jgi:hypothetical protein